MSKLADGYTFRNQDDYLCTEFFLVDDSPEGVENAAEKLFAYEEIDEDPNHLAKIKKAFEIIKEKKVNVESFVNTCSKMPYKQYKFMWEEGCFMGVKMTSKEFLAKEEYDLLKEVLL